VRRDRQVGERETPEQTVMVRDRTAAVRSSASERIELWAQAPGLELSLTRSVGPLRLDIFNCPRDSVLVWSGGSVVAARVDDHLASCRFDLPAVGSETVRVGPPDRELDAPFVFAVLSDVQRAINEVHEVFERMNQDPELRFVVSTGDLVNTGALDELQHFQRELERLSVPFYSTVGNHEMGADAHAWHDLFGPFNVHFGFKGVRFSLVDSGNATIDPHVYDWLDGWLDAARDQVHVVLTHVPPLDPVGLRGGGFRNRKEGAKLMQKLADGRADALFLGHIHSFYAFSAAGVSTYISGGGGATRRAPRRPSTPLLEGASNAAPEGRVGGHRARGLTFGTEGRSNIVCVSALNRGGKSLTNGSLSLPSAYVLWNTGWMWRRLGEDPEVSSEA
jgi:predicted phosphodiesterase